MKKQKKPFRRSPRRKPLNAWLKRKGATKAIFVPEIGATFSMNPDRRGRKG